MFVISRNVCMVRRQEEKRNRCDARPPMLEVAKSDPHH